MSGKVIQNTSPILPVHNVQRAMNFYRLLDFDCRSYQNGDGYAFLNRDGLEAEFRAAGAKILSPLAPREWKMNEFQLSDPDGNLLRFGEDLPKN